MPDAHEVPTPDDDARRTVRLATAAMGASIGALVVAVFATGSNLWWFSDDWNIFAEYSSGSVLEPFNDHLSMVPILGYRLMFETVGMEHYLGVQLLGLAAYALLGWAAFRYAAPRVGHWIAVAVASLLLWNSAASTNAMFPFLLNFSLPIALMLVTWRLIDSERPGSDVGASLALAVALATSALGVIVAGAIAVELVAGRAPLRRWLTLLPGPVLWLAWYVTHPADTGDGGSVGEIVRYAGRMFVGGARSLTFDVAWLGVAGAVVFVAGVAALIIVRRWISPRTLGAIAALGAFIGLTSVARVGIDPYIPPDELRYQWTVAAFMVLVGITLIEPPPARHRHAARVEAERSDTASLMARWRPVIPWCVALAVAGNGLVLIGGMRDWNDQVGVALPGVRSNIAAAELVGDRAEPDRRLPISYVPLTVGGYLDAVDRLGSPLAPLDQPIGGGGLERQAADELLVESLDIRLVESAAPLGCSSSSHDPTADGSLTVEPGTQLMIIAGDGPAPSGEGTEVLVSRFGEPDAGILLGFIPSGRVGIVDFPPDADTATDGLADAVGPYRVTLPSGQVYSLCAGG